jgi:hypothetical protein
MPISRVLEWKIAVLILIDAILAFCYVSAMDDGAHS